MNNLNNGHYSFLETKLDKELISSPLVFFYHEKIGVNPEESKAFLEKVFKAINPKFPIRLIHLAQGPISFRQLKSIAELESAFFFGVNPKELELNIQVKAYELINMASKTILFGHFPSSIEQDKNKKSKLWAAIKQLKEQRSWT